MPIFLYPLQVHKKEIFNITFSNNMNKNKIHSYDDRVFILLKVREKLLKAREKEIKEAEQKRIEEQKQVREDVEWINIVATAYTASADECGNSKGITASGSKVSYNRGTIAAPHNVPFNTKIVIPELNKTFVVEDRGNKKHIKWINSNTMRIDVYMEKKSDAIKFGVKKLKGYIIK
jgi:3D (Asp-Asp-Asp) domain-containing protein